MPIKAAVSAPIGATFGRWTVTSVPDWDGRHSWVHCVCSCGTKGHIRVNSIIRSKSLSCGCLKNETTRNRNLKHGHSPRHSATRIYKIWAKIKGRCLCKTDKKYPDYGGRGITLCSEWLDYSNFLSWTLANGYSPDLEIDRRDNNLGYSPDNCRWTDRLTQMNNTRKNRYITAFGETKSWSQWTRDPRCAVGINGIRKRVLKGLPPETIITLPPQSGIPL